MGAKETTGGQERASRREPAADEAVAEAQDSTAAETAERKAVLDEDVDAILDEIDEVLEVNSEEFVRGFVQKGGE